MRSCLLLLLFGVLLLACFCYQFFGLFSGNFDGSGVRRSDSPVSRDQAQAATSVNLPPSATACYYINDDAEFQSATRFIRFHIPPQDADNAAAYIISHNHYALSNQTVALKAPITAATMMGVDAQYGPAPWWKLSTITHGYTIPRVGREDFGIWYDADKSLIYVSYAD